MATRGRRGRARPRGRGSSLAPGPDAVINRRRWDRASASYHRRCAAALGGRHAESWGLWRVPEARLRLLGPVRDRRVLELGCGAARWTESLARRGAQAIGLDQSARQLAHARPAPGRRRYGLLLANAEAIPLRDRTVDLVFCDWGAMTFADPARTVPEVSRVLRPGGRFVFATSNPIRWIAFDERIDGFGRTLRRAYFDVARLELPRAPIEFSRTYADWIALFRAHGLSVERLVETRPVVGARSRYVSARDQRWAERWPLESIWVLHRDAPRQAPGRARLTRPVRAGSRRGRSRPG